MATHSPQIRPHGASGWLTAIMSAGSIAGALRLRGRLLKIDELDASDSAGSSADAMSFVTAQGVVVDAPLRAAAAAHAAREGLQVLDLVPADLPTEQLIRLADMVNTGTYRTEALAAGIGAGQAIAVDPDVLQRVGLERSTELDPVEMVLAIRRLKQFAPRATDLAVTSSLRAVPLDDERRMAMLRPLVDVGAFGTAAGPLVPAALTLLAGRKNRLWMAAAIVAKALQPAVMTWGTPFTPSDLTPKSAATRAVRLPMRAVRTLRGTWQSHVVVAADPRAVEERRPIYEKLLAGGTAPFFEDRRDTCPICTSDRISAAFTTTDLIQQKPGTFTIEHCAACGHYFQNPRLSIEGLDFYYRDFYDGLGEAETEGIFASSGVSYLGRVNMVARVESPERWLDVGAGHGHFCLIAAHELPNTHFDGLDMSESIDEAAARGWVETGYRGMFPEMAGTLVGVYDVVSMHHYLEHTREPLEELDAAHTVIAPGGLLLIELPNPDSWFRDVAGRFWIPWFQPQHQNLISIGNLRNALEERGFTVIDSELGPAHQAIDLAGAAFLFTQMVAPKRARPWLPEPTTAARIGRVATWVVGLPIAALGAVIDQVLATQGHRADERSNTYRVLARRDG